MTKIRGARPTTVPPTTTRPFTVAVTWGARLLNFVPRRRQRRQNTVVTGPGDVFHMCRRRRARAGQSIFPDVAAAALLARSDPHHTSFLGPPLTVADRGGGAERRCLTSWRARTARPQGNYGGEPIGDGVFFCFALFGFFFPTFCASCSYCFSRYILPRPRAITVLSYGPVPVYMYTHAWRHLFHTDYPVAVSRYGNGVRPTGHLYITAVCLY